MPVNVLEFRSFLIKAVCATCTEDITISDKFGEGYIDWHSEIGEHGLTFILSSGEKFSLIIKQEN